MVISVDGGRTQIRHTKKGKRHPTTNRHGYVGDWQEPKLLAIYVVDRQGKRVNTPELPVINDGTFGLADPFMQLLEMHLVCLEINKAKQVQSLADGAEWICLRIPPLLKRLGCPPESVVKLLDFYHAAEHLHKFSESAFTEPTAAQTWFKQARNDLKRGRGSDLIERMQAIIGKSSGYTRKTLTGELAYFTTA